MEIWQEISVDPEMGTERLVAEYKNRLFRAAMLMCRDPAVAEDLVFRTFAQTVGRIRTYRPELSFYNWIYTIMLNFRRKDLRRRAADRLELMEDVPESAEERTAFTELARKCEAQTVREAVSQLPLALAETVVLRYFEGMSIEEVSSILSVPTGTVKSRLNHARRRLRALLAERLEGVG